MIDRPINYIMKYNKMPLISDKITSCDQLGVYLNGLERDDQWLGYHNAYHLFLLLLIKQTENATGIGSYS